MPAANRRFVSGTEVLNVIYEIIINSSAEVKRQKQ